MALSQTKQAAIGTKILDLSTPAEMQSELDENLDNLSNAWVSRIEAKIKKSVSGGSDSSTVEGNGITLSFSVPYGDGKNSGQLAFSNFKPEELVAGADVDSYQRAGISFIGAITDDAGNIRDEFITKDGDVVEIPCVLNIRVTKSAANKLAEQKAMGESLSASFGVAK